MPSHKRINGIYRMGASRPRALGEVTRVLANGRSGGLKQKVARGER